MAKRINDISDDKEKVIAAYKAGENVVGIVSRSDYTPVEVFEILASKIGAGEENVFGKRAMGLLGEYTLMGRAVGYNATLVSKFSVAREIAGRKR